MTSAPSVTPRHAPGFTGKDLGEEYVILDAKGDRFTHLNATAREIYLLCDGSRSTDDVARALADAFEVDAETARADTAKAIEELMELGILILS